MKRLEVAIEPGAVNPILVEALELIRQKAVELLHAQGIKEKTGTLVNSLVTKATKSTKYASAWLKADAVQKTGADNARHAHLIEYGHVQWSSWVKDPSGGGRKIKGNRKAGIGRQVGFVRARPFFRPAVDAMRAKVRRTIEEGIVKLLWDSVRN
jgi:hypothetical protein